MTIILFIYNIYMFILHINITSTLNVYSLKGHNYEGDDNNSSSSAPKCPINFFSNKPIII